MTQNTQVNNFNRFNLGAASSGGGIIKPDYKWWVDPDNGDDTTGTGGQDAPFKTLQATVNAAHAVDIVDGRVNYHEIEMAPGDYTGDGITYFGASGGGAGDSWVGNTPDTFRMTVHGALSLNTTGVDLRRDLVRLGPIRANSFVPGAQSVLDFDGVTITAAEEVDLATFALQTVEGINLDMRNCFVEGLVSFGDYTGTNPWPDLLVDFISFNARNCHFTDKNMVLTASAAGIDCKFVDHISFKMHECYVDYTHVGNATGVQLIAPIAIQGTGNTTYNNIIEITRSEIIGSDENGTAVGPPAFVARRFADPNYSDLASPIRLVDNIFRGQKYTGDIDEFLVVCRGTGNVFENNLVDGGQNPVQHVYGVNETVVLLGGIATWGNNFDAYGTELPHAVAAVDGGTTEIPSFVAADYMRLQYTTRVVNRRAINENGAGSFKDLTFTITDNTDITIKTRGNGLNVFGTIAYEPLPMVLRRSNGNGILATPVQAPTAVAGELEINWSTIDWEFDLTQGLTGDTAWVIQMPGAFLFFDIV